MKILYFSIILLMIPVCVLSQEVAFDGNGLATELRASSADNYHIVTPVLMRESSSFIQTSDDYAIQNGNKFQAFFSSLIIPGSGQVKNRSWWRAGLFFAIEATSVYLFVDHRNNARIGERNYEKWANKNWSVVQYSDWLVKYHEVNNLSNPHIDELRSMIENEEASFNIQKDWEVVDQNLLRNVERNTPYITSDHQATNNFSHVLPEYGSQQYYELIAKYYQYQSGWRDYDTFHNDIGHTGVFYNDRYLIDRGGAYASPYFYDGAKMAKQFNTDFRNSGYFAAILIANHVLSAFDAYFTLKVKQNRLQATSSIVPGQQINVSYRF